MMRNTFSNKVRLTISISHGKLIRERELVYCRYMLPSLNYSYSLRSVCKNKQTNKHTNKQKS